jgi:glycosyltransferase involved in cell wall biosynthesis
MKVMIMVLAADVGGFDRLVQSIKDTWGTTKHNNCDILYYYGYRENYSRPPSGSAIRINDDLICGVEESIDNINVKTKIAFEYIYNNCDFDYVFRCCAGSYINQCNLIEFLIDKPKNKFYCGASIPGWKGSLKDLKFASGSGYFLSKDLVKFLIDHPSSFTYHKCDDVAIGMFLTRNGIQIAEGRRQDINIKGSERIVNRVVLPDTIQGTTPHLFLDARQYHYHFRHSVEAMHAIHKVIMQTQKTRKRNNIMLHCNQAFWRGGTILFMKDMASVYPEFHHVTTYFHDSMEDYVMMDEFLSEGIDVSKIDKLTEEIVEDIDPVIIIFHNTPGDLVDGEWPYNWLKKWPLIAMHHNTTFPAFYADLDIFVSQTVLSQYEKIKPRMNWKLIPPCIDLSKYAEIDRSDDNKRCVVGKLTSNLPTRYPKELVVIFERIQSEIPDCGFLIIGGADHWKDLKLSNCVMPKTGSAHPKTFYEQMDIFVHKNVASTIDSWSRVVSEAMASGLPVVVENRGGPSEQINHGVDGFLCNTDNDFVTYITKLAKDPALRYSIGMRAREKALREFGIDRFRRETSDVVLKAVLGVI